MKDIFPDNSQARKELPVCRGVIDYFPDAIAAVSHVSFVGNQQHNPGQPLHWARSKSTDHADCILRHLMERGGADNDGVLHSAKLAWRALALLQEEIEAQKTTDHADSLADDLISSLKEVVSGLRALKTEDFELSEFGKFQITDTIPPGKRIVKAADVPPEVDRDYRFPQDLADCRAIEDAADHQAIEDRADEPTRPIEEVFNEIERDIPDDACDCDACRSIRAANPGDAIKIPMRYFSHLDSRMVAEFGISKGLRVTNIETSTPRCYIAGPMTGYEQFNFPAFDEALERLEDLGWDAISPANLDRQAGIDPSKLTDLDAYVEKFTADDLKKIIRRDVRAILSLNPERDSLAVLPGWEASTGSVAEVMLGRWLGLPLMDTFGRRMMGADVDYAVICTKVFDYLQGKAGLR